MKRVKKPATITPMVRFVMIDNPWQPFLSIQSSDLFFHPAKQFSGFNQSLNPFDIFAEPAVSSNGRDSASNNAKGFHHSSGVRKNPTHSNSSLSMKKRGRGFSAETLHEQGSRGSDEDSQERAECGWIVTRMRPVKQGLS